MLFQRLPNLEKLIIEENSAIVFPVQVASLLKKLKQWRLWNINRLDDDQQQRGNQSGKIHTLVSCGSPLETVEFLGVDHINFQVLFALANLPLLKPLHMGRVEPNLVFTNDVEMEKEQNQRYLLYFMHRLLGHHDGNDDSPIITTQKRQPPMIQEFALHCVFNLTHALLSVLSDFPFLNSLAFWFKQDNDDFLSSSNISLTIWYPLGKGCLSVDLRGLVELLLQKSKTLESVALHDIQSIDVRLPSQIIQDVLIEKEWNKDPLRRKKSRDMLRSESRIIRNAHYWTQPRLFWSL
ncbi:hypothetical protein BDA99DRAFT_535626 [Phascolomyces articulosus]|uniref:Uncharacterized protein n=1 Tax=Phascolomyces articulosus TaxID=60185 RepID=A0AAD5KE03_9FUNG|nr:hypothetical protein BDA99DRAFT_535626 [Phascolomyces articulosus]